MQMRWMQAGILINKSVDMQRLDQGIESCTDMTFYRQK